MRVLGILNQPYCLLTIRLNGNKKVKTQIVSQTVMTWQALKKAEMSHIKLDESTVQRHATKRT